MTRPTPVPETVTLRVPFRVVKRGGRKLVIMPDGGTGRPQPRVDSALVKALARAHRWQRMLDSGEYANLTELAAAEKINLSLVSRLLRLTLLAPDVVEAIMVGRQQERLALPLLMKPFPVEWQEQNAFRAETQLSIR